MNQKSIMVIAGEISGDMHAAAVVRAIRRRDPAVIVFGIGGDELRQAGMELFYDTRQMGVLGVTEVVLKYRFFRKVFNHMLALVRERRPDLALLVDYPGFNLAFAKKVHARGVKVLYYICPQVWAWNRARIPKVARIVDRLMAIFPFETEVFKGTGLTVDFVGHPLVTAAAAPPAELPAALPWQGDPRIAILPGSRYHEVKRMLPVMWSAAALTERQFPEASFIIAVPGPEVAQWARALLQKQQGGPRRWALVVGQTRQVLRQARAAWVTSGTATIEAALMRCPMVVVYKVALVTYWLGRRLIRVPWLGMVNILAGRELCPELIQGNARPADLAETLEPLICEGLRRTRVLEGLETVSRSLGPPGAAERAAEIVLEELNKTEVQRRTGTKG